MPSCGRPSHVIALALAGVALLAPVAHASQWTDIATISSTLGNNANYLCVGGGSTDIGCPTTAPYLTGAGNVGFGMTNPAYRLDVSASWRLTNPQGSYFWGQRSDSDFDFQQSDSSTIRAMSIHGGQNNASTVLSIYAKNVSGSYVPGLFVNNGDGHVSIGHLVWATALDVAGTLKISNGGEACSAATLGAIKYASGAFYICQNATNGWEQISTSGATTSDHIASSTTSVYANGTGYISLTTGGTTTGYFDTAGRLVAPGVSLTTANGISSTNGYFSGNVGVGTGSPSSTLHVYSASGGAWTQIGTGAANFDSNMALQTTGGGWILKVDSSAGGMLDFMSVAAGDPVTSPTAARIALTQDGKVGVGTITPTTAMDISGTLKIADGGDACDASHLGSIKYASNKFYLCRNAATGWEELTISGNADVQTFLASGTWTKPSSGNMTRIQCWGAGGGGSSSGSSTAGGGGGGAYFEMTIPTSQLGVTETVTIGAGGAVDANGGNTTFGTWLTAYGGAKGTRSGSGSVTFGIGGGGGGVLSAGSGQTGGGPGSMNGFSGGDGSPGGSTKTPAGDSVYGGGGGGGGYGAASSYGIAGGNSLYGGGGGGGRSAGTNKAGGTSLQGGAGGDGGVAGTQPGGGGGAAAAGGDGECIITTS